MRPGGTLVAGPRAGHRRRPPAVLAASLLLLFLTGVLPAAAKGGDLPGFETHAVPGITIRHHPTDAPLARQIGRDAPGIARRIRQVLGTPPAPVTVVLVPRSPSANTTGIPDAPEWASGYTFAGSGTLYMRASAMGVYPDRDAASLFAHELSHVELQKLAAPHRLPRWFEEGACMVLARPWDLRDSYSLTLAQLFGPTPEFADLADGFPREGGAARRAYARSFSYVSWLARKGGGSASLGRVADQVGKGWSFDASFALQFGVLPEQAEVLWKRSTGRWYRLTRLLTSTTTFWIGVVAVFAAVLVRRRRRTRAILQRWELEDGPDPPQGPIEP